MSKYTLQFDDVSNLEKALCEYIIKSDDAKIAYMHDNKISYQYIDNGRFALDIDTLTPDHLKEIKKLSPEQLMLADGVITINK